MSSNLSKLKFMAKARELQAAKTNPTTTPTTTASTSIGDEAAKLATLEDARWVLVADVSDVTRKDAKVDPILKKGVVFRRSFGGLNPVVEQRTGRIQV